MSRLINRYYPLLCIVFTALFILPTANAAELWKTIKEEGYVSDFGSMLSSHEKIQLKKYLKDLDHRTGATVLLVTIKSLQGGSIEDFSVRLADRWNEIREKGKRPDIDLILLIAKRDKKMRIEVSYNLEGKIPDSVAMNIIHNDLRPHFKRGKFYTGISAGLETVGKLIEDETGALKHKYKKKIYKPQRNESAEYISLIVIIFLIVLFTTGIRFNNSRGRRGPGGIWISSGGFGGGGYSGGGSSGFSGGFGGGGFGGGGASGGW